MRLERFRCYCFAVFARHYSRRVRVFQNEHTPSSTCIECTTDRVVPTRKLFGIFCLPWYDDGREILALMTHLEHWRIHYWPRCVGLSVCTCREIPKKIKRIKMIFNLIYVQQCIFVMYNFLYWCILFCSLWGELIWYGD